MISLFLNEENGVYKIFQKHIDNRSDMCYHINALVKQSATVGVRTQQMMHERDNII